MWSRVEFVKGDALRWGIAWSVLGVLLLALSGCGRAESCTVETLDDGAIRISCDDGTEAILEPPEFEGLPAPCTAEEAGNGDVTIRCPGSDPVTLAGGIGATGPTGPPGPGCTVVEESDGQVRVTCGEASVIVPGGEGCEVALEEREGLETTLLVCGPDEVVLAVCGNGRVELGQECDFGPGNGEACTPEPGAFSCQTCSASCELGTTEVERATLTGLLLHVNEGALGAVPDARIDATGGYHTWTDDFGVWTLEVPAGEELVLRVESQDVSRVDIDPSAPWDRSVRLATAPIRQSVAALSAGEERRMDLHVLSGQPDAEVIDFSTIFSSAMRRTVREPTQPDPGPTVVSTTNINLSTGLLRRPDGSQVPRGAEIHSLIVPIAQPPHSEDITRGDEPLAWGGVHRLGLPERASESAGLADRVVLGGAYFGMWYEGEPLQMQEGITFEEGNGSPSGNWSTSVQIATDRDLSDDVIAEDLEAWYFDAEAGEWVLAGPVVPAFLFDPDQVRTVNAWRTQLHRLGWWVLALRQPVEPGCVTGTLTLDGEPVGGSVSLWGDTHAQVAQANADGAFCAPAQQGSVNLMSTALLEALDRRVAQATVDVESEGSCSTPTSCADVGEIALETIFDFCDTVGVMPDLGESGSFDAPPFVLPLSLRHGLESYGLRRSTYLDEDQWLLGRQMPVGGAHVCMPRPAIEGEDGRRTPLVSNDLDAWCKLWAPVFAFPEQDVPGLCGSDCDAPDAQLNASAELWCVGE